MRFWWIAVREASGRAFSGSSESVPPQPERLRAVLASGKSDSFVVNTAQGEILIAMLPMRTHLQKNWSHLEVAVYSRGLEDALYRRKRDLWSALSVAVALLAAVIVLLLLCGARA